MKPRILHVSTVHHPADPRLALRVMPTLAAAYALTAVLPNVQGVAAPEGVQVWSVPYFRKLWWRLLVSYPLVLFYALRLRPVLIHLYDPELIPMGLLLKALLRVPVVLEVHENLHKKLDEKARIHGSLSLTPFLHALPDYSAVRDSLVFHGYTEQRHALRLAAGATAGVALWKPVGDHADSYPTKLFEYMALSLPVLTADLPLCRAIVEANDCGLCVSPTNPEAVADALAWFIAHPDAARQMGERGRRAVEAHYDWKSEAGKLNKFYQMMLPM